MILWGFSFSGFGTIGNYRLARLIGHDGKAAETILEGGASQGCTMLAVALFDLDQVSTGG
jgi:hypothetical protein